MLSAAVIISSGLVWILSETANLKLTQNEYEEITELKPQTHRVTQSLYDDVMDQSTNDDQCLSSDRQDI